jgi:excisionase family DNA binding protein
MRPEKTRLLTITEAADLLGVHQKILRSWVDKGLVPHIKTPNRYRRFEPLHIRRLQDERRIEVEGKDAA